ncbi:hypothetical protein ACYUJ6_02840 [Clostridium sp. JNZ X4-2]
MDMENLCLNKEEIKSEILKHDFEFAWINTYSELYLKRTDDITDFEFLDNLIEAKFFNKDEEMSIMENQEERFSVVIFNSKGNEDYIEEGQILKKGRSPFRDEKNGFIYKLIIRHYLNYDCDGQAYVEYTKLYNIKEEKDKVKE